MYNKIDSLKVAYMDKKYLLLKGVGMNETQQKELEQKEIELMQKLQNTFGKLQDFTSNSSSFDTMTNSIISHINFSKKHLKPLNKIEDFKYSDKVYDSSSKVSHE